MANLMEGMHRLLKIAWQEVAANNEAAENWKEEAMGN